MPTDLSPNAVGHGRNKLSSHAQVGTECDSELFGAVVRVRHVPFELVHQGQIPHMDVQLKGSIISTDGNCAYVDFRGEFIRCVIETIP